VDNQHLLAGISFYFHFFLSQINRDTKTWAVDTISTTNVQYNPENRIISFSTTKTVPHAIVQHRFLDFPLQWWCIFPSGRNSCTLTFITKTMVEIVIQVFH